MADLAWHQSPKGKRAIRFAASAIVGLGFGLVCAHVPDTFKAPCHTLAKLAALCFGG